MSKDNFVNQLIHISNVLDERTILYEKRQLETKRAIKAMHRGNIIPSSLVIHNLLTAHISFFINKIGFQIINQFIEKQNSNPTSHQSISSLFNSNELISLFSEELLKSNFLPIEENHRQEIIVLLFDAVFNYNENKKRQNIIRYLKFSLEDIIKEIFRKIVILDEKYTIKIIKNLEIYYENE